MRGEIMSPLVAYALLFTAWARYMRCDTRDVMSKHLLDDIGLSDGRDDIMRDNEPALNNASPPHPDETE